MQTRHFTFGIALLMLTGAVGAADARTRHILCKGAGTFAGGVETHLDTNGDGASATLDQGNEICNIGPFSFQEEVEWIARPVTSSCPSGTTEELYIDPTHGQQLAVATNTLTGDQLFGKIISATLCFNFSTFPAPPFPFTASGQAEIIGGTGKYTGATGPYTFHTVGSSLIFGIKDGVFGDFGQFTFTSDGTLTLPDNHDH